MKRDHAHAKNMECSMEYEQLSLFNSMATTQLVGELLTSEREPRNAVGTYCGSKGGQFIGC